MIRIGDPPETFSRANLGLSRLQFLFQQIDSFHRLLRFSSFVLFADEFLDLLTALVQHPVFTAHSAIPPEIVTTLRRLLLSLVTLPCHLFFSFEAEDLIPSWRSVREMPRKVRLHEFQGQQVADGIRQLAIFVYSGNLGEQPKFFGDGWGFAKVLEQALLLADNPGAVDRTGSQFECVCSMQYNIAAESEKPCIGSESKPVRGDLLPVSQAADNHMSRPRELSPRGMFRADHGKPLALEGPVPQMDTYAALVEDGIVVLALLDSLDRQLPGRWFRELREVERCIDKLNLALEQRRD